MKKLVLHFCCGPCGAGVVETLLNKFSIIAYFYNPNIWPVEEYKKRLAFAKKIAQIMKIEMTEGPYEDSVFEKKVSKLTQAKARDYQVEKEGGKRCMLCYRLRLEKTAIFARENNIDIFATTLSISPHKKADSINAIGTEAAKRYGINFYEADFKKNDGFGKSIRLSRNLSLYRQKYCGCQYSIRERCLRR